MGAVAIGLGAVALTTVLLLIAIRGLDVRRKGAIPKRADPLHYVFAHRLLPQLVFANPERSRDVLASHERDERMAALWERLARETGTKPGPSPRVTLTKIPDATAPAEDATLALVHFPPPRDPPEAYLTAAAFLEAGPRYFTLERGVESGTGKELAFFCEWTHEGKHLNRGTVGTPTGDDFLGAIQDALRAS